MEDQLKQEKIERVLYSMKSHSDYEELKKLSAVINPLDNITNNYIYMDQYKFMAIFLMCYYNYLKCYKDHGKDFKSIDKYMHFCVDHGELHTGLKDCLDQLCIDFIACNTLRDQVKICIVSSTKDQLLLVKKYDFYKNINYCRPCGGRIGGYKYYNEKTIENPIETAIREAKEELNLDIRDKINETNSVIEFVKCKVKGQNKKRKEITYFIFDIPVEGDYKCTSDEVTLVGYEWKSIEECKKSKFHLYPNNSLETFLN